MRTRPLTAALCVIALVAAAGCASSESAPQTTTQRSAKAAAGCGDATPQDAAGVVNAYLDGPGSPIVAGRPGCARIAALWARLQAARRARVAPYVALQRAAARGGWALVDSQDPRWRRGSAVFVRATFAKAGGGEEPMFVFTHGDAAVVFVDLEP